MFIFGHIGITILIFYLLQLTFPDLKGKIRYELIPIGALLPDLIDKPLGRIILQETLSSGRIFAHTLIFWVLIAGLILLLVRDRRYLILPGAALMHLAEDFMWETPEVLFWPLMGWGFPADEIKGSFLDYFLAVVNNCYDPAVSVVFVGEIAGILVCLVGVVRWRRGFV